MCIEDIEIILRNSKVESLEDEDKDVLTLGIKLAVDAHKVQLRKGTNIPYIVHPIEVGKILSENGCSRDVITAGVLHDTIEDTEVTKERIKEVFGENILSLVLGASEPEKDKEGITWKQRKEHTINYLQNSVDENVLLIACADKLSNMRSIHKDYNEIGDKLWDRFNAGFDEQKWYYENLLIGLNKINSYTMYDELCELVSSVFNR